MHPRRHFKWLLLCLPIVIFLLLTSRSPTDAAVAGIDTLWLDISLGPPLVTWFNQVARGEDIARIERVEQMDLLERVTIGRKLVVFKSVAEAQQRLPFIAEKIDIIGYNLEQGPGSPAGKQADPVGSVGLMRELAGQYNLDLAMGPDRSFALNYGTDIAPLVDMFVLQVQRVQTEPETVRDFVVPLVGQLRQANPDLQISVQVRTEGDVQALVAMLQSLEADIDGISILTSPETVPTAESLVMALREAPAPAAAAAGTPFQTAVGEAASSSEPSLPLVPLLAAAGVILMAGGLLLMARARQSR